MEKPSEENLKIGTKIQIGSMYADAYGLDPTQIIELIEGFFEEDNGLYTQTISTPSIWNKDSKEFDSIYHLFGNEFEYFMDCKIV